MQAENIATWRRLVRQGLELAATPFYLFSVDPIRAALEELQPLQSALKIPVRHWLSCKTQPVKPLLRWWQRQGYGIEVVSDFELRAALHEGFAADKIVVNGPAKHRWLKAHNIRGLRVNFDSVHEIRSLLPFARKHGWRLGLRIQTSQEHGSSELDQPTQFGLQPAELIKALQMLAGVTIETVHFHLGTNIQTAQSYERALSDLAQLCAKANFAPKHLDCGGGLPPPNTNDPTGRPYNSAFRIAELAQAYARGLQQFPSVRELWLENGRFLSARSGVLIVRILDLKERGGLRQLICDGGRTMNALISTWEQHDVVPYSRRAGTTRATAVYGPTCMAFDRLASARLPTSLRVGDYLIWMDAGAYHLPWETHFSHGLAAVLWHEGETLRLVRPPESFEGWWGRWLSRKS